MNVLQYCCVALVVLITGCANLDKTASTPLPDSADSPRTASTTQDAAHVAIIPGGPLQPITAASAHSSAVTLQLPPADLWDRIRRGFAMPDLESDLVRDREQWYATRPDYIQRMTERSSKYLFHVVEELEVRGMPTELALLPYIESAFNPQAVSSAKAVLASTRAALDYLQKLYNMFGDWHLALAAYNWGEGSVGRAIARNQKAGLPTSYTDLNMPAETRMYVPKLQAVKNIVAAPEKFSAELPLIENHPYFQSVDITRDIDVALAAQLADVTAEDFRALNPSTNQQVILAAGTPQILLPWDNAVVFKRNLEAYTQGQYASWGAWTVPATMTVAAAAQRVGMSEADMRSINNIPPRMLIKAGSALIVPRSAKMGDVASHVADNGFLSLAPEVVTRKTTVKAGRKDTVASIARRYRLNAGLVADWNDVKSNASFQPGEAITLFLPVRANSGAASTRSTARASKARVRTVAPANRRAVRNQR
jgi:membrane-bound lytic murein transglycosylase D